MKQYLIIFILFSTVCLSCGKDYLNTVPTQSISTANAFETTQNGWAAINGIHRSLYIKYYGNQDQSGQGAYMIYMDTFGEDIVYNGLPNRLFYYTSYTWQAPRNPQSNVPYFIWRFHYTIIANANNIINNIDDANGPQMDKDVIKAQALTYRANSLFQTVQLFGERYEKETNNETMGIPIVTSSTDLAPLPRASVEDTYQQINADLDNAIALFKKNSQWVRPNKSHLNLNVAQGIKARVALTQQNWTVAAEMAREARTGFSLMPESDYFSGFNNYENREWMWGFRMIAEHEIDFYSFFAYFSANFNASNVRANPKSIFRPLFEEISATDYRRKLWDETGTNTEFPIPPNGIRAPLMHRKFLIKPGQSLSIGDVPMMRASEMHLIEAEAKAQSGDPTAAQTLYTLAKERDPEYRLSSKTGAALVDEILLQRRIELWGEGFRYLDLKRLNKDMDRRGGNHNIAYAVETYVPAGDKRWVMLVPQTEIDASNGVIVQNPL